MALSVKFTEAALKFLNNLSDRKIKEAIKSHITELSNKPLSFPLSKPLRGRNERCCRVRDYRILFLVVAKNGEEPEALLIVQIGHRKDVYE